LLFCRQGISSWRRSRLKLFWLYFALPGSVYTKFGTDLPFVLLDMFLTVHVSAFLLASKKEPVDKNKSGFKSSFLRLDF
ncbi:hypothetical protein ACTQ34_12880, partial [Agathobaculum sp. LCP25S3_E8]|uniref:hypothetical protein n=1 Tax=Agathobaculum sp. LCP25S3_E8 TaxID=3438735 RepID=UPI003F918C88